MQKLYRFNSVNAKQYTQHTHNMVTIPWWIQEFWKGEPGKFEQQRVGEWGGCRGPNIYEEQGWGVHWYYYRGS